MTTMEALPIIPEVGSRVMFAEGTPQWPANADIVYVVQASPSGEPFSRDAEGRPYVWLVDESTLFRVPSRRKRRTGWADALVPVTTSAVIPVGDLAVGQVARPPATPMDLFRERPDFHAVTVIGTDGGWTHISFADGSGYVTSSATGTVEVRF